MPRRKESDPTPRMNADRAIKLLRQKIEMGKELLNSGYDDNRVTEWENSVQNLLMMAFGEPNDNLQSFHREGQYVMYEGMSAAEHQRQWRAAHERRLAVLNSALEHLSWQADEPVAATGKEPSLFANLHSEIASRCTSLYEHGSYSEAVERSFKVVRDRLRTLTGYETGSEAFGKTKLHIKGAAAAHVDQDFNEGVKFLTMAIDRFRNEKAHTADGNIQSPVRAYEYLRLSSLAMHLLDGAEMK